MFERAGLEVTQAFGNFDGTKYTLDSPRIIIVGRKPGRLGSAHRRKRVGDKR
jgi:hypothetical protein